MKYLEDIDLEAFIQQDQLDSLIEDDDTILDKSESYALARVSSYLSGRWNIDQEYTLSGDARNLDLVQNVVDLTIFYIHKRTSPRAIPSHRIEAYTNAIEWLKDVNKGNLNIKIAKLTPSQVVPITYGTNERPNNGY